MTSETGGGARTPWHLWLVGAVALVFVGFGAVDFVATVTRFGPYVSNFPPELMEYFYGLPVWIYAIWGVTIAAGLIGAVLLLLRRKLAAPLIAVSTIGPIQSLVLPMLYPPPIEYGGPISATVITAIPVLLFVYAVRMTRRGILR
jgi:hypothetical protein